ncbi:MAG: hypothetical protein LBF62_13185 [Tannerellaceae bacterium]|jgi:hypothetical protein|nr:hypothetical protein [Tannerellaceae bacterium]
MKTNTKIKLLLFCLCIGPGLRAQVSVGTDELPAKGALLQLKDIPGAAPGAKNATKGLLLPRVELASETELTPMFPGATDAQKKEHAGLLVYNLTETPPLKEGLMLWDGQMWSQIKYEEVVKEIVIAKKLYTGTKAVDGNSVKIDNLEITLGSDVHNNNNEYFAYPKFKKQNDNTVKYSYQMAQYWQSGNTNRGYENTLAGPTTVGGSYIGFANNNDMSPLERNEIWMVNENKHIYHIQFFVLGPGTVGKKEIYAILVEKY